MKFICQKAILLDAISIAARAVSPKNAIPALEGILLECNNNTITLTSYNMEIGIVTKCAAQILEDGKTCVNARLFSDIIRKLPDEEVSFDTESETITHIKCQSVEFSIPLIDPSEFPELPTIEDENSLTVPQNTLKDMITKTIFATAQTDIKPILTGLYFDIHNKELNIVAIDNFRMSLRKEPILLPDETIAFDFVLPGSTARELEKILDDKDDTVTIFLSSKRICFKLDETTVISRLLEGKYYDYTSFIPKKGNLTLSFSKKRLADAAERVSLIINERLRNHIRFSLQDNIAKLSCSSTLGNASDEISMDSSFDNFEIGFNNRIFIDAIKAIDDDNLVIELSSAVLPAVITPKDKSNFLQIIMPVRLKN